MPMFPTLPKADMEGEGDTPLLVRPLFVPLPPLLRLRLMPPMGPVGGGRAPGLGAAFSCTERSKKGRIGSEKDDGC